MTQQTCPCPGHGPKLCLGHGCPCPLHYGGTCDGTRVIPPVQTDERSATERVEDAAFEHRIRTLTTARKWHELRAVLMVYGSALDDRQPS